MIKFNELFGSKFKKDIEVLIAENNELKKQVESLTGRLEKQEEKVRKATAVKQSVEEELKEARKKIESLESQLAGSRKASPDKSADDSAFRIVRNLSASELDELLFFLGSMESEYSSLVTIYSGAGERVHTDESSGRYIDPDTFNRIDRIESRTGKAVFFAPDIIRIVIIPPVPISLSLMRVERHFDVLPLKETMERDICICVLIAHAGESFIGIADKARFLEHEIIKTSVMGKHSKGGWSQKRFEKLVEEDVGHHIQKVKESLGPMLKAHDVDLIIASGEKQMVDQILEDHINTRTISRSIDTVISKQNLDTILRDVWSSRMYVL